MLTKTEFLTSLSRECTLTKHLVSKIDAGHLDHRFTEKQRSLGELMVYLAIQLEGTVSFFTTGSWDRWSALEEELKNLQPSGFAVAMDKQYAAVEKMLATVSDADLATRVTKNFSGEDVILGTALLEYTLKFSVAYKMQFFLQAKDAGLLSLSSANLWQGRDAAPAV